LLLLARGGDYGWPQCYYDAVQGKLVLAPEYGGDGGKTVGACATKSAPIAAFPAHWAPNAMVRYDKRQFPARYHDGVFIAFHGSWNRAPYPQGGYNVVFQALAADRASGMCEIFADGFAGAVKTPDQAAHRPSGLAVGPDGALFVSDDLRGRIYRIVYRGGSRGSGAAEATPCPGASAPAGEIGATDAKPPEGTHPDAGAAAATASLPVPPGHRQMTALGDRTVTAKRVERFAQAATARMTGTTGARSHRHPMVVERWQLRRDRENDRRRRAATQRVSLPHAALGRRRAHPRSSVGTRGLHLGHEPPRAGRAEFTRPAAAVGTSQQDA
jgi:hypothetical protein